METELYTQSEGLFNLQAPKGWQVSESGMGAVFADLAGESQITITLVNTGYKLDDTTFLKMVDNRETYNAFNLESYIEVERRLSSESSPLTILYTFIDDGKVKKGASVYRFEQNTALIVAYWTDERLFTAYTPLFDRVYASIQYHGEGLVDLPVYAFDPARPHSNGEFSIMTSPLWGLRRVENDFSIVETFISPDENAIIQTLVYNDGQSMTMNIAGDMALTLLRNSYTKLIMITKDEILADGREKLTWKSLDAEYQGITTFTVRGNAAHILTVLWDQDPDQFYQAILTEVVSSYTPDD